MLEAADVDLKAQVDEICGAGEAADTTCQFDALATENLNIGSATKATGDQLAETADQLGELLTIIYANFQLCEICFKLH